MLCTTAPPAARVPDRAGVRSRARLVAGLAQSVQEPQGVFPALGLGGAFQLGQKVFFSRTYPCRQQLAHRFLAACARCSHVFTWVI